MEKGRHEVARRKIDVLREKWTDFYWCNGIGHSFSNLVGDIYAVDDHALKESFGVDSNDIEGNGGNRE